MMFIMNTRTMGKTISVRIPDDMKEDLQRIAHSMGVGIADVLRLAVAAQLEQVELTGSFPVKIPAKRSTTKRE